jgi:hypothetical protein
MQLPMAPEESHVIGSVLASYLDNEHDKGLEGIGSDLSEILQEPMLFCANGDGDVLELNLLILAHIYRALDIYQDDPTLPAGVAVTLMKRINSALPDLI